MSASSGASAWPCRRQTTLAENESASKEALEAFLRDSDRLAKCHSLKEGLFTTERQKTILDGFVRVFDAYQMDPAAVSMRSDCVPLERALLPINARR